MSKTITKKKVSVKEAAALPEEGAPEAAVSFEDFLKSRVTPINPGLVASFRYEASRTDDGLAPRTEAEWLHALEVQSNRTYK